MEIKIIGTDAEKVRQWAKRIAAQNPELDPCFMSGSDGKVTTTTLTVRDDGLREVVK